jgi:biotin synthase
MPAPTPSAARSCGTPYLSRIVEFSNHCAERMPLLRLRASNSDPARYRMTPDEISRPCGESPPRLAGTVVLQGANPRISVENRGLCAASGRSARPAITLSVGNARAPSRPLARPGLTASLLRSKLLGRPFRACIPTAPSPKRLQCLPSESLGVRPRRFMIAPCETSKTRRQYSPVLRVRFRHIGIGP